MKRIRISTLMLLVVIAALVVALVVEKRRISLMLVEQEMARAQVEMAVDREQLARAQVAVSAASLVHAHIGSEAFIQAGSETPDLAVDAYRGGKINLSDLKGKVVVLDFWATWCGFSLKGLRHLEELAKATEAQGVTVLAVARDDEEIYRTYVARQKPTSIHYARDPTPEEDSPIFGLFHATRMPTTYIIGRDGRVVAAFDGYLEGDDRVEQGLKQAGVALPKP